MPRHPRVTYEFRRLAFIKADIEPLADDEEFRVVTPVGTFQMTKAQFYDTFHNVAASMSYRQRGLYHYPAVPDKALRYRIG